MATSTRNPLHVSPLSDADQIRYYEFLGQVSFRSVDMHIKRGWALASEEQEKAFGTLADTLEGPIVYSLLSAEEIIGPGEKWKDALRNLEITVNWRGVEFPVGTVPRPVRGESHMYLLVRIALGRATQSKTGAARFPEGFSSCLSSTSGPTDDVGSPSRSSGGNWWHTYLIKNADQVLPTAMLDIVFEPMRISTSHAYASKPSTSNAHASKPTALTSNAYPSKPTTFSRTRTSSSLPSLLQAALSKPPQSSFTGMPRLRQD